MSRICLGKTGCTVPKDEDHAAFAPLLPVLKCSLRSNKLQNFWVHSGRFWTSSALHHLPRSEWQLMLIKQGDGAVARRLTWSRGFSIFLAGPWAWVELELTDTGRCRELPSVAASGHCSIPSILNFSDSQFSKHQQDVKQVAPKLWILS